MAAECFRMLTEVYGEECMARGLVFEWRKCLCEVRENFGHARQEPTRIFKKSSDRRFSIRMIAEMVSNDKESVSQMLYESLNMTANVCARVIPKVQRPLIQKKTTSNFVRIFWNKSKRTHIFLESVIACGEPWIFQYDPGTTRQSMHWKISLSPRVKKARQSMSTFKTILIVFFDIKGA